MLVQICASIPELHDLRWAPIGDLLPKPSGKSAVGPFPGLRNLRNTCFLNAVCQCMIHVSSLRKRLRASEAVRALLPRQELALSFERFIEEYTRGDFATMCPAEVVKDFFLSWARAKPFSPMVAGEQHDAVEALMHILAECGLMGGLSQNWTC